MEVLRWEETGKRHRDRQYYKFSAMDARVRFRRYVYAWVSGNHGGCPPMSLQQPSLLTCSCWDAVPGNVLLSLHLQRWKSCTEIAQCSMVLSFLPVQFVVLPWPRAVQCLSSSQNRSWHCNMIPWSEEIGEMSIFMHLREKKNLLYEQILSKLFSYPLILLWGN